MGLLAANLVEIDAVAPSAGLKLRPKRDRVLASGDGETDG
jgi:hypothetical protein